MVLRKGIGRLGFWLPLGLFLPGCGGTPAETVGSGRQAIVGGQLDPLHTNVFGTVVRVGDSFSSCSATLIAPNLLLTARHCVSEDVQEQVICGRSELGPTFPPESLVATNAMVFAHNARWFRGAEIHVPSEGADTCGFDVALVVLNENVPKQVATPAVPRIDRDVEFGEPYIAVGYGIDDLGLSGDRRSRSDLAVACEPGSCGFGVRGSEFVGETGVCSGDSGGPALDANGKVVGVVSRGGEDCTFPIYSTVTSWRDLLMTTASHAATRGGYTAPFWVTTGVSDPPPKEIGEPCALSAECVSGAACHESAQGGICAPSCETDASCEEGRVCLAEAEGGLSVCVTPPAEPKPHDLESTCAFAAPRPTRGFGWVAVLGVGLAYLGRRRSRHGKV